MSAVRIAAVAAILLPATWVGAGTVTDLSASPSREPARQVQVTAGQGGTIVVSVPDRAEEAPRALTGAPSRSTRYVMMRVGQGQFVPVPQR
ncbi:MAG TPA: hypothetical protein VF796_09410 [Humisphaera sp.]